MSSEFRLILRCRSCQTAMVCLRPPPWLKQNSPTENCFAPKGVNFLIVLGEEEAVIPAYYNDDEPESAEKTRLWAGLDYVCLVLPNCAHLRQNLLKNNSFKVLRSFHEQKMSRRQGGLRRQTLTVCQEVQRSIMPFFAVKTFRVRLSSGCCTSFQSL